MYNTKERKSASESHLLIEMQRGILVSMKPNYIPKKPAKLIGIGGTVEE
jgi:hypothetical protein